MTTSPRPAPSIDLLLNLVPDRPDSVTTALEAHPTLASTADYNGYTLLHAASSYGHLALMRLLVQTYHVDPNVRDNDGDTPIFYAETVEVANCLLEELGADASICNGEGESAIERADSEEWLLVASYLREREAQGAPSAVSQTNPAPRNPETAGVHPPPPLPNGVNINIGHVSEEAQQLEEPDPEFRRRIEELAARDDFQGEDGQRQLRELVTDAVRGVAADQQGDDNRAVRRRLD